MSFRVGDRVRARRDLVFVRGEIENDDNDEADVDHPAFDESTVRASQLPAGTIVDVSEGTFLDVRLDELPHLYVFFPRELVHLTVVDEIAELEGQP